MHIVKSRILLVMVIITTCLSFKSYCQFRKTIIIDTVIGENYKIKNIFQRCSTIEDISTDETLDTQYQIDHGSYETALFSGILYDSINIVLDNVWGVLTISGIRNYKKDTIRINKWIIYKNGINNKIKGYEEYRCMYNDSLVHEVVKYKRIRKTIKNEGRKKLKSIDIVIDNRTYIVPVELNVQQMFSSYHGYKPYQIREAYYHYLENTDSTEKDKIFSYYKFHGDIVKYQYQFSGELKLQ